MSNEAARPTCAVCGQGVSTYYAHGDLYVKRHGKPGAANVLCTGSYLRSRKEA